MKRLALLLSSVDAGRPAQNLPFMASSRRRDVGPFGGTACISSPAGCHAGALTRSITGDTVLGMSDQPSGRFLLRLPVALHGELTDLAREQGVSLNQLVVALLAGGIGFTLED